MHEHINNNNTFYDTVRMSIDDRNLILVLEGTEDKHLLSDHISEVVTPIVSSGKNQSLAVARRMTDQESARTRFLIDRDYDDYTEGAKDYPNNVITSKNHDIFVDIIAHSQSPLIKATKCLSRSHIPSNKAHETSFSKEAIKRAYSIAMDIAALRVVNARHSLGLDFKRIIFNDLDPARCSVEIIADFLIRKQDPSPLPANLLSEAIEYRSKMESMTPPPIGDHDLFRALRLILRSNGARLTEQAIRSNFMAALDCSSISFTEWHQSLQDWATTLSRRTFSCPCPREELSSP